MQYEFGCFEQNKRIVSDLKFKSKVTVQMVEITKVRLVIGLPLTWAALYSVN